METYSAVALALGAFFLIKTLLVNDLSSEKAREMIRDGAVIVDVRSEEEYHTANVEKAINIPLHDIRNKISGTVPERDKVVLLYCRSGSRSFMGKRILKKLAYNNVYNLGSLGRARRIANQA